MDREANSAQSWDDGIVYNDLLEAFQVALKALLSLIIPNKYFCEKVQTSMILNISRHMVVCRAAQDAGVPHCE